MRKVRALMSSEDRLGVAKFGLLGVADSLYRREYWRLDLRRIAYSATRKPAASSPYPISLYSRFVAGVLDIGGVAGPLATIAATGGPGAVLRHDIDTRGCVERLPVMIEAERRQDVRSTVMYRTDGETYPPADCAEYARELRAEGFEIGLHSTAYLSDEPYRALEAEIRSFEAAFGFPPTSYNFHGLGVRRLAQRLRLMHDRGRVFERFPCLKATDSISGYYWYRVQDCHGRGEVRHLKDDFVVPPRAVLHHRILVLTHPTYWADER